MSTRPCSAHHPNASILSLAMLARAKLPAKAIRLPHCAAPVSAPAHFLNPVTKNPGKGISGPLPRRSLSSHTVSWHIRRPRLVSSGAERKEHAGDGASPESGERRREDYGAARIATSYVVPARPLPPPGLRLTYRGCARAAPTATLYRPPLIRRPRPKPNSGGGGRRGHHRRASRGVAPLILRRAARPCAAAVSRPELAVPSIAASDRDAGRRGMATDWCRVMCGSEGGLARAPRPRAERSSACSDLGMRGTPWERRASPLPSRAARCS
jgi:hypothetical protein